MIVEILVTKGEGVNTLGNQDWQRVLHPALIPLIREAGTQPGTKLKVIVDLSKKKGPSVAGEVPTGKIGLHFPLSQVLKFKSGLITVCLSLSVLHALPLLLIFKD